MVPVVLLPLLAPMVLPLLVPVVLVVLPLVVPGFLLAPLVRLAVVDGVPMQEGDGSCTRASLYFNLVSLPMSLPHQPCSFGTAVVRVGLAVEFRPISGSVRLRGHHDLALGIVVLAGIGLLASVHLLWAPAQRCSEAAQGSAASPRSPACARRCG